MHTVKKTPSEENEVVHTVKEAPPDMKGGQYDLVSEQDGEFTSQPVYLFTPNKKKLAKELGGWFITWQETTMLLARNKELTLTDWRVIAVLQARLDFDNWIRLSQSQIGSEIDVAQPNVSASMRRLIKLDVVLLGPSTRGVRTYRLNPNLMFKGSMRNAVKQRREAPKLTLVQGGKDARQAELLPVE